MKNLSRCTMPHQNQRPWLRSLLATTIVAAATVVAVTFSASAQDFTASASANDRAASKVKIPVYLAVPKRAYAPLNGPFSTSDTLVDFVHPDAARTGSDVGLRLIFTRRANMSRRLGSSGIFKTGDILLSFRPGWGGAGAYPNIQMGISHAGLAYVDGGKLYNLDTPLNEEYLGRRMRADLTSSHYNELNFIHVVRPRGLTDNDRENILAWSKMFVQKAHRIYPEYIKFNDDYNAPKFRRNAPLSFVRRLANIGLGHDQSTPPLDLYCSEFVWSVLSLRDCDPSVRSEQFKSSGIPSCVKPPMTPLDAAGRGILWTSKRANIGLVDGPVTVIETLNMAKEERRELLESVFTVDEGKVADMSEGHKKIAKSLQPKFAKLRDYYLGASVGGILNKIKALYIKSAFNRSVPENYSPASFLVNSFLPENNIHRKMDYVATIVIE